MLNNLIQRAYAQNFDKTPTLDIGTAQKLEDFVSKIANVASGLIFTVSVIFIIMAAVDYLGAAQDPKKTESAKNKLIYAAVAIGIAAAAYSIPKLIVSLIGA